MNDLNTEQDEYAAAAERKAKETAMYERQYTEVVSAEDVTEEVLERARSIESGWYADRRIDWEDVWDRLDGYPLADGTNIDLGPEINSPAMRKIQRVINKERREG